jgi:hypothetical protein
MIFNSIKKCFIKIESRKECKCLIETKQDRRAWERSLDGARDHAQGRPRPSQDTPQDYSGGSAGGSSTDTPTRADRDIRVFCESGGGAIEETFKNTIRRRKLCQQEIEWDLTTEVQGRDAVWDTAPVMTSQGT